MAKVTVAPPLSDIRGKVGNLTYSKNASGNYVTQNNFPTNPRSLKQSRQRAIFASQSSEWANLFGGFKSAWGEYASLPAQELTDSMGNPYYASAKAWFLMQSTRLVRLGLPVPGNPNVNPRPNQPHGSKIRITTSGSNPDLTTGGTPSASSESLTAPPSNAFDNNIFTQWRALNPGFPEWVQYEQAAPYLCRHFSITGSSVDITANPLSWVFQGWDGASTTDLMTETADPTWTLAEVRHYYFTNETSYIAYRLKINSTHGAVFANIFEMDFFEDSLDGSALMYSHADFLNNSLNLFSTMRNTPGSNVATSNFRATIESAVPFPRGMSIHDEIVSIYGDPAEDRKWFFLLHRLDHHGQRSSGETLQTLTIPEP